MNTGIILLIIFIAIIEIAALIVATLLYDPYLLLTFTPSYFKTRTKMNAFGRWFCFILLYLLFPTMLLPPAIYWLFHVRPSRYDG